MNRSLAIWQFIYKRLQQQMPVMLLYVLESKGSSPGRVGFAMAVDAQGHLEGSVGGGIMEHKFVELAREKLCAGAATIQVRRQVHRKEAPRHQSGMICSGEQTLLLYALQAADLLPVRQLLGSLAAGCNGLLEFSPAGLRFSAETLPDQDYFFAFESEQNWLYREKTGYTRHLHLVGGGHCALALSQLVHRLDFCLHLYEDRPTLNTFLKNTYVQEKRVVSSYEELAGLVPAGQDQYVVIMTFGYRTDDLALRALLPKFFRFLGVLGSQRKINKLFDTYRQEGIAPECLSRVYAPVGLPINSQTPAEIAVSIAAQLIKVKNQATVSRLPPVGSGTAARH